MNALEQIHNRRSVRAYRQAEVSQEQLETILEAGIAAPSGKNGQPWRFVVVQKDKVLLKKLAAETVYFASVSQADCLIFVFLDKPESYHYLKDVQAIGACIENMLLAADALGLGACWNGEILRNADRVKKILSIDKRYDFMAMIVVGYPDVDHDMLRPKKKPLSEVMLSYE